MKKRRVYFTTLPFKFRFLFKKFLKHLFHGSEIMSKEALNEAVEIVVQSDPESWDGPVFKDFTLLDFLEKGRIHMASVYCAPILSDSSFTDKLVAYYEGLGDAEDIATINEQLNK